LHTTGRNRTIRVWKPIFEAFKPVRHWLADNKPDVLLTIFNDHVTSFFFDHYSHFVLGIDESYAVADEGGGARKLPPVRGHSALAQLSCRRVRHVVLSRQAARPRLLLAAVDDVAAQAGMARLDRAAADRRLAVSYKLGQALRRAIKSYPEDIKVALVATGGLSHQVHGERAGFNNAAWDKQFLELIEKDPVALTRMTVADYARLGGVEGAEVIMWLTMRGAMFDNIRCLHQSYYLPSMSGIATAVYENEAVEPMADVQSDYCRHIGHQLAGIETLTGTYPFTLDRRVKGFRINKFLHALTDPAQRAAFLANEDKAFAAAELTADEGDMVRRRDWRAMIHYGARFFMLEKLGAVVGVSNLHIYSAMRGETLEEFQKTRNAPGALYSVAGEDAPKLAWDKAAADG
jgi:gallate dioxygenase